MAFATPFTAGTAVTVRQRATLSQRRSTARSAARSRACGPQKMIRVELGKGGKAADKAQAQSGNAPVQFVHIVAAGILGAVLAANLGLAAPEPAKARQNATCTWCSDTAVLPGGYYKCQTCR